MPTTESELSGRDRRGDVRLRLAPGTKLLGRWEGAAYHSAPYLVRRSDGQHLQLSQLLYQLADCIERSPAVSGPGDLAADLSESAGRDVSADDVLHLLSKLIPLGILAKGDETVGVTGRPDLLLGLRFRAAVIPARVHRAVTSALTFLFWPPLVAFVLAALAGADVWLGLTHGRGVLTGTAQLIAHPGLMLVIVAMTLAAAVIHETGHATGTRAGGATPGVMGVGVYLVWPVFYTDISDSYRLDRTGRLRADLGGVYFNALTLLAATAGYALTGWSPLLVFITITHLEVLTQFLPFVRLDGYWVVSDLVGVPNLFAFMGPTVARLTRRASPGQAARLDQIKPWARRVIAIWVAATAVVLTLNMALITWIGPDLVLGTCAAIDGRARQLGTDLARSRIVAGVDDLTALVFLAIPAAGITYIGYLLLTRAVRAIGRLRRRRPVSAAIAAIGLAALLGLQAFSLVPGGTHRATGPVPAGLPPAAATGMMAPSLPPAPAEPSTAFTPDGTGSWTVAPTGAVKIDGNAPWLGSAAGLRLAAPTVAIAATPDGRGYWLAAADGGVFTFGDAGFYGSVADLHLNGPVVSITPTPDGRGYWLAAADGGVFTFGDGHFFGSLGARPPSTPVVGMSATPDGRGYWLAGADGRVLAFGDAGWRAVGPAAVHPPVRAIATSADGFVLQASTGPSRFAVMATPRSTDLQATPVEVLPVAPDRRPPP